MAEKRMFSNKIVDEDDFLNMPVSSRLLYYDLGMRADDDGFVKSPKKIMRVTGATQQDFQVLIANKFIIPFDESGVIVIRHWRIHNYIRKDMYHPTMCESEKSMLIQNDDGCYELLGTDTLQACDEHVTDTSHRLDKNRLDSDKNNISAKRFVQPTLEEVASYCQERKNNVDPQRFFDHYNSNGWVVGRTKMKDWKAAVRTWERNNFQSVKQTKMPVYGEEQVPF